MGSNRHTHVGPFLKITVKAQKQAKTRKVCPANEDHLTQFPFCPDCGTQVEEIEYEVDYIPTLYDLMDELNEDFFPASEKGNLIVALPNHAREWVESVDDGHGGWHLTFFDDPATIIAQSLATMCQMYPKTLKVLQEHESVESLEFTFGVVTYWM